MLYQARSDQMRPWMKKENEDEIKRKYAYTTESRNKIGEKLLLRKTNDHEQNGSTGSDEIEWNRVVVGVGGWG